MPFEVTIDRELELVSSVWRGRIEESDCVDYIEGVWGDPSVGAYDEFVDFREVVTFDLATESIQRLVQRSRDVADLAAPARSVLLASEAMAFGLSRMYVSMREQIGGDRREWQVMSDHDAAVAWLGETERG